MWLSGLHVSLKDSPGPVVLEWLSSNGLADMKGFTLICHTVPHTQPQRHQSLPPRSVAGHKASSTSLISAHVALALPARPEKQRKTGV